MPSSKMLSLLLLTTINLSASFGQGLVIKELTCNYATDPLAIEGNPSLSWKLDAQSRGQKQTAYQIIVEDENRSTDVWNSGKVLSGESTHIRYSGPPLEAGKRYYWKTKVWDKDGVESGYSSSAFWETAPDLRTSRALWISAPSLFDARQLNQHRYAMISGRKNDYLEPLPLLRKQFGIGKKLLQARLYISGVGFHEVYLNGEKISDHVLSPAFTNYDKTVLYIIHDVTSVLKQGQNAIGIMLGNGWYNSSAREVWGFDHAPWRADPTVKAHLKITYEDGTIEDIVTDETWRAIAGPIVFSNLWQGEYYDARREVNAWSEPEVDESKWQSVRKVAGPIGILKPQTIPPVKVTKLLEPISSTEMSDGTTIYDFGQNIAGMISLTVKGKSGTRLQFRYAERLTPTGGIDQSNINNLLADSLFQTDRYTLKGGGEETWSPRFVYHGFRYAELSITGEKPESLRISAQAINTAFDHESEFSCSDEMINKIQQSTLWSFRNNFIGFPTDCPQREKNGWTGDAQLACETGLTNFNTITSYRKWLGDLRDEQRPDGNLPGIVPTNGWGYYWGNGPAWDIACVVIPWSLYQYTGDVEILRENYGMMKKYVDYMASRSPEYIADFGLGDWIPVETETPVGVTSTGYFFYGAKVISDAAAILDKSDDEKKYAELRDKIKAAFNQKYFNAKSLTYANGSQTALSCALFQGLVQKEHQKAVQEKLVAAINSRQGHIDAGILGARYLPHVLSDMGRAEVPFKMITAKSYPGWGYWIEQGATTLWEDWKGEGSLNHIMFGDVSSWFYKTIAGIRPKADVAGFREFIIKPTVIKGMTWAKGEYESIYGTIVSNWQTENGQLTHHIEVPVGTTAFYHLPVATFAGLTESNKPITKSSFPAGQSSKKEIVLRLESGVYEFSMPLR